jgi:glycosyltransferase involved in cell wall biosynthesis
MFPSAPSNSTPRILGVLIARNEWPLLGISITHALVNHVDELIVVDHASTDETKAGLAVLQKRWGNKIQVVHMCEGTFHHEEANLLLKSMYRDRNFDWVYPIDSDEFLITPNNQSLKELLADVPSDYVAARYQLHNFVVPTDFEESDFRRYGEIREKAVAKPHFQLTHENIFDSVVDGSLNFFDVPFASKVMFRHSTETWAVAGSHSLLGIDHKQEFNFSEEETFVAHLPFLTRDRLRLRVAHGKNLAKSGYSPDFGWQSQVVHQMEIEGRLDEYWKRNSIPINASDAEILLPKTMTDDRLSPVLQGAVEEFTSTIDSIDLSSSQYQSQCGPAITLSQGINSARAMALHKQKGIDQANSQVIEAHVHISNLNSHIQNLQAQLQEQVAQNSARREEIFNSISWRATTGLRLIHRLVKSTAKSIR